MRHGWFVIPGVQTGDRTLTEQRMGVGRALGECSGKTVLDLGCAEGLLSREFAVAGARSVHGVDSLGEHLVVAQDICNRYPISFEQYDMNEPREARKTYDIVLALGVAHKLLHPEIGIRYAAQSSGGLVLVRMTRYAPDLLTSKWKPFETCDVNATMTAEGFALDGIEAGPRQETVHYYRRRK